MTNHMEPMDVDCMDSDFDNKENSYHHSNVLPCTEKGYEELDVSELNMKLRYSITPAASPMSKSYTAYVDKNIDDDSINCNENTNLTRSLNSTMTNNDSVIKSLKNLPLQSISTELIVDNRSSVLRQFTDSCITGVDNVTITVSGANDIDENLSLPSSSSSAVHTPEATTPTNISKNEEGSPIIRGLKSVFNMFRSSQSPILSVENDNPVKQEVRPLDETYCEDQEPQTLASTPISAHRSRDSSTSKRSSPLKDSIAFSDDLEKELQWKDDTILFSEEKIPIHKLFLPLSKPMPIVSATSKKEEKLLGDLNSTVEYMDVSYNNSVMLDNTVTEILNNTNAVDSDCEFEDCETTITRNESLGIQSQIKIQNDPLSSALEILDVSKDIEKQNECKANESVEKIENETYKKLEIAPKTLDLTFIEDIEVEDIPAVTENEPPKEKTPITDADITLDVTRDIVANVSALIENIVSNSNEIQKEPTTGALYALDITREIENFTDVIENLESNNNIEIEKEPLESTSQNNYVTMKVAGEKDTAVTDCGLPVDIALLVENGTTERDVSTLLRSDETTTEIKLVQKADDEANNDALHNVTLPSVESIHLQEHETETVYGESLDILKQNQAEITFEVSKEVTCLAKDEIDIIQSVENERTTGRVIENTQNLSNESQINYIETNVDSDVKELQNATKDLEEVQANFDSNSDNTLMNILEYLHKGEAEQVTEASLEDSNKIEENTLFNMIQSVENERTTGRVIENTQSLCNESQMNYIDTYLDSDVKELQNATKDLEKVEAKFKSNYDNTQTNILEYLHKGEDKKATEASLEVSNKTEEYTQFTNDYDAETKETHNENFNNAINSLLAEKSANISSPDKDFETLLTANKDKIETTLSVSPDVNVLDSVNIDSNLDVTETLNTTLNNINIIKNAIGELEVLPPLEKLDVLNETSDIVNSLTEIIGESPNNTVSESVLDQSRDELMKGIECKNEIKVLPDLVNETIHNVAIDNEIVPVLISQIQTLTSTEPINEILKPNVPETISDVTEEHKAILSETSDTSAIITRELINELINTNNEHTNAITVPLEDFDARPESQVTNKGGLINKEVENELKEKDTLEGDGILDAESKKINEGPFVDEELVLSNNNSPYVSVTAENESKPAEESFEKIDIPYTTMINEAPSSPPIRSKGYNFNFDEMDDPFATKSKIRLSPPTPSKAEEHDSKNKKEPQISKKVVPNRRISQDPERKKLVNKKKLNTTVDTISKNCAPNESNEQNYECAPNNVSVNIFKNTLGTNDNNDVNDKEQVLDKMVEENIEATFENDLSNVQLQDKISLAADSTIEIKPENKSSIESMTRTMSEIKTSSSEQSTYYSAAASSSNNSISKNVFNLPEIDDKNFNPFATKLKMRQSPPLDIENENLFASESKMKPSPNSSMAVLPNTTQKMNLDAEDKMDTELMEKDTYNIINTTSSSKCIDNKNITAREVNTEDEDTEEGPFLEADDVIDKLLDIHDDNMMQFNEITPHPIEENIDDGELFIDAEAFEFLLNQNKSNVVADSGKESLFLKFDPLFAKTISSGGVLAALNNVQKRQSTPTKPIRPSLRNEASPIAGPSTLNTTNEGETNVTQDSIEDLNVTVAKPMMVVTPAVNPAATPKSKTATPPRSNRRSITFTSPAMAVIDRLLSLSGNNSLMGHDTTITQANREHAEADVALTQLRELLAEKEISVYQLRSESKELKDRLSTMETQVKILEADGQERLNKINDLNDRLAEKTKVNKSMAAVVEEYERTIASLIAETEQDRKRHAEERIRLINERDEQTAHLASMEVSFSDLHSKYEKSKQVILSCKANEETCKKSIKDFEANLTKMQTNYEMLKQHATSKLNHANQELQKMNKTHESEVLKLNALIKRKDMHITSLEETLAQKTKANEELTAICDELINKVG